MFVENVIGTEMGYAIETLYDMFCIENDYNDCNNCYSYESLSN